MKYFCYNTKGRQGLENFLSNTCGITVTRFDDGRTTITDDDYNQCAISLIMYESLINHGVITRI